MLNDTNYTSTIVTTDTTYGRTKVKQTSRSYRIWIEGDKLAKHGFDSGMSYTVTYNTDSIVLTLDNTGKRKVTMSRPIIDLHCADIGTVFQAGQSLSVEYTQGNI